MLSLVGGSSNVYAGFSLALISGDGSLKPPSSALTELTMLDGREPPRLVDDIFRQMLVFLRPCAALLDGGCDSEHSDPFFIVPPEKKIKKIFKN